MDWVKSVVSCLSERPLAEVSFASQLLILEVVCQWQYFVVLGLLTVRDMVALPPCHWAVCFCQNWASILLTAPSYSLIASSYPPFSLLLHSREPVWGVILENVTRLNMAPAGQGLCQSAAAGIFGPCVGRQYESLLFVLLQKKNVTVCLLTLPQIERFSYQTRFDAIIVGINLKMVL